MRFCAKGTVVGEITGTGLTGHPRVGVGKTPLQAHLSVIYLHTCVQCLSMLRNCFWLRRHATQALGLRPTLRRPTMLIKMIAKQLFISIPTKHLHL